MKKFYALFIAMLVAVVAFAQGPKARRAVATPAQFTTLKMPVARTLTARQLPASMKKRHPQLKAKAPRKAAEEATSYVRVSSRPESWDGEYLIVYENADGALAMNGGLTDKLDAPSNTVPVTIVDQEIACTDATAAISFTIEAVEGGFSIKSHSGLYMGWDSAEKNGLNSSSETAYVNTLGIDTDGNANIVAESGSYLRYNLSQNQERFRYFKSSTYTNQQPVALYKKGGEKTEVVIPEPVVLPEGLETEPYAMQAVVHTSDGADELNETVQVAFDGDTIYVQGLSYWFEEAWAKGIISGDKVLFASNQVMGEDEYGLDYLIGYVDISTDDFAVAENIIFDYDPETRILTLSGDNWFGESNEENSVEIYNYCDEMTLTPGEAQEPVNPEIVELPDGLTASYHLLTAQDLDWDDDGNRVTEDYEGDAAVAYDGNDVYIQGLCHYLPEAWVKGTKDGNTVVVPSGQFCGTYGNQYDLYFVGFDEETEELCDVTFTLDEEGVLTTQTDIMVNGDASEIHFYYALANAKLTPTEVVVPQTVELPDGLTAENYVLVTQELGYADGDEPVYTEVNVPAQVAFDKETGEVYVKGLCSWLPEAWVKGTYTDSEIVLPTGQYFGVYESLFGEYPFYFVGANEELAEACDVKFLIQDGGKLLTTSQMVLSCEKPNLKSVFVAWKATKLIKPEDKAATPSAPVATSFYDWDEEYEFGSFFFNMSLLDVNGEAMMPEKLSYKVFADEGGQVSEYKFTADLYEYLDEDMTEVPFLFDDDYDFERDGVYFSLSLNSPTQTYNRIGVQSIYRGGNAENKSEITWYDIVREGDAVKGITDGQSVRGAYYNLAGQRVEKPTKGIYIRDGRKIVVK